MTTDEVLIECFRHFIGLDESNAAMHCAEVRYSPITFRIAECLAHLRNDRFDVAEVLDDRGAYAEDPGR